MKKALLIRIKELYKNGENIIKFLRGDGANSVEDIAISYDFQAGNYVDNYYNNIEISNKRAAKIANYFDALPCKINSIFEAGVGEATTMVPILNALSFSYEWCGGVDLSWSRIKVAQKFAVKELKNGKQPFLCLGDMFSLPLKDNAVDVVYTVHAMEPNGGKEKELLKELYRITCKYLVLIEPSYSLANDDGKRRMEENGYVKDLPQHCRELGYHIFLQEPFELDSNPLNPAEVIIIEKDSKEMSDSMICDPITKDELKEYPGFWYSDKSMLAYPVINGVSCLNMENAVVCTKMNEYI